MAHRGVHRDEHSPSWRTAQGFPSPKKRLRQRSAATSRDISPLLCYIHTPIPELVRVIKVKHISMDDPLYQQEVALRTTILLAPIGYTIQDYYDMAPGREERCEHFVAVSDHPAGELVLGAATLFIAEDEHGHLKGKVQQVCVDQQRQGEGIGKRLMIAIEARGFGELGLARLYCHAQLSAIPFYEKLGWEIEGDEFTEAGIPHRRMFMEAPEPVQRTDLR